MKTGILGNVVSVLMVVMCSPCNGGNVLDGIRSRGSCDVIPVMRRAVAHKQPDRAGLCPCD